MKDLQPCSSGAVCLGLTLNLPFPLPGWLVPCLEQAMVQAGSQPQEPGRLLSELCKGRCWRRESLMGFRVLSLQKAAPSSDRTRISSAVSSISVSSLPFFTFPLPPFQLLSFSDPVLEVQAGSCMSWPCILLAES